jgi:hypothetical protein
MLIFLRVWLSIEKNVPKRHVTLPLRLGRAHSRYLKGIDRSFELRCEIRLNRLVMTNWRLGNFFYFILKGQHHKVSKKPIDAA